MTSRAPSFAALILTAALGGCLVPAPGPGEDPAAEAVGSDGRAIVGGTRASAYPEAVLVDMKRGGRVAAACSGALVAPRVVLTAGHCVHQFDGWNVSAPYAAGQKVTAASGATYDWTNTSETVAPDQHDIGLVFLDQPISLAEYPTLASAGLPDGASVVNIGRIDDGTLSSTNLYVSRPLTVRDASSDGFSFDYLASEIIQSGDSGGPVEIPGGHTIVAVNSGAGGGTEVLARVDLLFSWIDQQIEAHGGHGPAAAPPSGGSGATDPAPAPSCAHDLCATGKRLAAACDPCVQAVCAEDAYCCSRRWDARCVSEVASVCGDTCGGAGGQGGGAPANACGAVRYAGACQGSSVVWCEKGSLHHLSCDRCGFDASKGYYDCL